MALDYENIIHYWINRLGFVIRKELQNRFNQNGEKISAEEWVLLMMLWQEDRQTPGHLADATVKDRTTMTRLLDAMVHKGLITRETDPDDRRRVIVGLSERGKTLQNILTPIVGQLIEETMKGISRSELRTTVNVLQKMSSNFVELDKNK